MDLQLDIVEDKAPGTDKTDGAGGEDTFITPTVPGDDEIVLVRFETCPKCKGNKCGQCAGCITNSVTKGNKKKLLCLKLDPCDKPTRRRKGSVNIKRKERNSPEKSVQSTPTQKKSNNSPNKKTLKHGVKIKVATFEAIQAITPKGVRGGLGG